MQRLGFLLAMTSAIFLCAAAIAPERAYACSCAVEAGVTKQERIQEAFSRATAVFAGEVTGIEDPPPSSVASSADPVTVTFDVSEAWKGAGNGTREITTPMSGASCGYEFQSGEEYLVYAPKNMEVWLCGETKPLSDARADLEVLGTADDTPKDASLPDTSGIAAPYAVAGIASLALILATFTSVFVFLGKLSRRP